MGSKGVKVVFILARVLLWKRSKTLLRVSSLLSLRKRKALLKLMILKSKKVCPWATLIKILFNITKTDIRKALSNKKLKNKFSSIDTEWRISLWNHSNKLNKIEFQFVFLFIIKIIHFVQNKLTRNIKNVYKETFFSLNISYWNNNLNYFFLKFGNKNLTNKTNIKNPQYQ